MRELAPRQRGLPAGKRTLVTPTEEPDWSFSGHNDLKNIVLAGLSERPSPSDSGSIAVRAQVARFMDKKVTKFDRRKAREQYLKDYVAGGIRLFWQRHAMYFGAFLLSISYYGVEIGVFSYLSIILSEVYDHLLAQRINAWSDHSPSTTNRYYYLVILGTVLNACAISAFVVAAAWIEGGSSHFTPLMFLFAAALFAAMNTHQIIPALTVRLAIYAVAFVEIATQNLITSRPPISSSQWLHFFTVVFVMYFIVDCSFAFLKMYRINLRQLDELRKEHAFAVNAYRAKAEFLSIVSHELRTPITSIKGSLSLAQSGKIGQVPESIAHFLTIANKNANRLATLIDDLLDFQAIEAGKLGMELREIDIYPVLHDAIEITANYLKDKHVDVKYVGNPTKVLVIGDPKRLMQVLANVLSNAVKFSNDYGTVEVDLIAFGRSACISVRDFGKGIPQGCEERVFSPFSQIDSSDARPVNGTGLGMCVSRSIMREHDGNINYESELGSGTVFNITIPVSLDTDRPARTTQSAVAGRIDKFKDAAPAV